MPEPPDRAGQPDDAWADDAWDRDAWKRADWGKPARPTDAPREPAARKPSRSTLGTWGADMVEAGPYLSLGLQSAASMAFFVGVGYLMDGWLGTRPWGLIVGAVLGMTAVITLLVRLSNAANAASRRRREGNGK